MKKLTFEALHYDPIMGRRKVEVNGWQLDDKTAIYKSEFTWFIIDLATGMAFSSDWLPTKKDAVEAYKKLDLEKIRNSKLYEKQLERVQELMV